MVDNPLTSIDIEPEGKYNKSTLASSRNGLLKSSSVPPQKNNQSVLPLSDTNTLQKNPKPKRQKEFNEEEIPKINKYTQNFEGEIQQSKRHNQKDNTYDNSSTK